MPANASEWVRTLMPDRSVSVRIEALKKTEAFGKRGNAQLTGGPEQTEQLKHACPAVRVARRLAAHEHTVQSLERVDKQSPIQLQTSLQKQRGREMLSCFLLTRPSSCSQCRRPRSLVAVS